MVKHNREQNQVACWSHQAIIQSLCGVLIYQDLQKEGLLIDEGALHEIEELEEQLRYQIEQKGGLEEIEEWFKNNSPRHSKPSDFTQIDWGWLKRRR